MFYSILDDIDADLQRWADVNHCKATTLMVLIVYALFLLYSLIKQPVIQFVILFFIMAIISRVSTYTLELNIDYHRKRVLQDQEDQEQKIQEEFENIETPPPTADAYTETSPSVEPSTTE